MSGRVTSSTSWICTSSPRDMCPGLHPAIAVWRSSGGDLAQALVLGDVRPVELLPCAVQVLTATLIPAGTLHSELLALVSHTEAIHRR
jgi:hypothetical protein